MDLQSFYRVANKSGEKRGKEDHLESVSDRFLLEKSFKLLQKQKVEALS